MDASQPIGKIKLCSKWILFKNVITAAKLETCHALVDKAFNDFNFFKYLVCNQDSLESEQIIECTQRDVLHRIHI